MLLTVKARGEQDYQGYIQDWTHNLILKKKKRQHLQNVCSPKLIDIYIPSVSSCCLFKVKVKVNSLSRVWLFATPWTVAYQAPLSVGFSRQEYWSGLKPSSSVHGIFQARVLERFAVSFSRRSSQPRDQTWVSHIAGRCFTIWATREAYLR